MTKAALVAELMQLTPEERIQLLDEVYALTDAQSVDLPLTAEEKLELDRRWDEHQRDPASAIPVEEIVARLRARFG